MRIRGAIFDVDGTLLDSMFIWDTIGETYLRSIGYQPKENLNETFKNMSLHQAARYYQTEYGVTLSVLPPLPAGIWWRLRWTDAECCAVLAKFLPAMRWGMARTSRTFLRQPSAPWEPGGRKPSCLTMLSMPFGRRKRPDSQ